ncbi:hypothetical protein C8F01DRAFT_985730 [Mycena amicta]|nr:hypothetical protein C8F01DRAFT_985730 [Mycena amicta]
MLSIPPPDSSPPSSPASSNSDLPFVSPFSKSQYLKAQIRQKDAIIESLLKQLHNPYTATPLAIDSFRMATSPSDATNINVVTWLDQLQAGTRESSNPQRSASDSSQSDSFRESQDEDTAEVGGNANILPDATAPIGLIANLSLASNKQKKRFLQEDDGAVVCIPLLFIISSLMKIQGVASASYFTPGPATNLQMRAQLIQQQSPPEIVMHGLVAPEDVDKLFELFYTRINPFIALLDPVLHTPASTFARCPFLYTVVCAISSRYSSDKSEIYPIAMHFAKQSAATALIDGWKSVELCQAYILMSMFSMPARKWEEDRSWLYAGLAFRLATDLNLHQVATNKALDTNEQWERERLNRTRVWMVCSNLDRSMATQLGKPAAIRDNDRSILRHGSDDWYKMSPYNSPYDVHLCCYTGLQQLLARFGEDVLSDPVNQVRLFFLDRSSSDDVFQRIDFRTVTVTHDAVLTRFTEQWGQELAQASDANNLECILRCKLLSFLAAYSRLVMFSFGFQQAYPPDHVFFCLESAKEVLRVMVEDLAPTGFMRYAPDEYFTFAVFASAFLFKASSCFRPCLFAYLVLQLLRPDFSHWMVLEEENQVVGLIDRLIQTLSSSEVAIDDRHTPRLYAHFLAGLLSRRGQDGAPVGRLQPQPPPTQQQTPPTHHFSRFTASTMPRSGAGEHSAQGNGHGFGRVYAPTQLALLPDEQQLFATLKNPGWWDNVSMIPGHGSVDQPLGLPWPESSRHSPTSDGSDSSSPYHAHQPLRPQPVDVHP